MNNNEFKWRAGEMSYVIVVRVKCYWLQNFRFSVIVFEKFV